MVNFSPLTAEIGSGVWSTLANFNGFRVIDFVTAATSLVVAGQPNFARCSAVSCAGIGLLYVHVWSLLLPNVTRIRQGGHHVWHRPTFWFTLCLVSLFR